MTDRGLPGVAPKGAVGAMKRIGASRDVALRPDDLAALPAFEVERLRVPAERR